MMPPLDNQTSPEMQRLVAAIHATQTAEYLRGLTTEEMSGLQKAPPLPQPAATERHLHLSRDPQIVMVLPPPQATPAPVVRPKGISARQARRMLVDAVIEALRTRPQDWEVRWLYRTMPGPIDCLHDKVTGQLWNYEEAQMQSSTRCGCQPALTGGRLGYWQQRRVRAAMVKWVNQNVPNQCPYYEEAQKMIEANRAGR